MMACKYNVDSFVDWEEFNHLNYKTGSQFWKPNEVLSKKGDTFNSVFSILDYMEDPAEFLYEQYWESVYSGSEI